MVYKTRITARLIPHEFGIFQKLCKKKKTPCLPLSVQEHKAFSDISTAFNLECKRDPIRPAP